jgi:hypothetical protein
MTHELGSAITTLERVETESQKRKRAALQAQRLKVDPSLVEQRAIARLAWNGWPDNEVTREHIAKQEEADPYSAEAWDRVVRAIKGGA